MTVPTDGYTGTLATASAYTEDSGNPGWVFYQVGIPAWQFGGASSMSPTQRATIEAMFDQFLSDLKIELLTWGAGDSGPAAGAVTGHISKSYTGTKTEVDPS